ncbi:HNH endonuclease family protein [Streptomyces sp. RFCAC02]|uniref:HNH endonuclease family protein n=1 Tax=Streptomyces sp. RFCAC02 TaxID=2499143 RepID=UPI001F100D46|nr:HNH endonuclease family protein [Streptomyces sp. RFCAC02]
MIDSHTQPRATARRGRSAALAVAAVLLPLAACDQVPTTTDPVPSDRATTAPAPDGDGGERATALPGLPSSDEARDLLAGLTVADAGSMSGYSRDRFPHWATRDGCTVRQLVLARDGADVTADDECQPQSGTWTSAYDGETFTDPGDLDIDHIVPLANAWRSGADEWTDEERETFANDLDHPQLLAVSAASNRSKGDQGPEDWLPPGETFHCDYARAWTAVKDTYGLTVTAAEHDSLTHLLDTCP